MTHQELQNISDIPTAPSDRDKMTTKTLHDAEFMQNRAAPILISQNDSTVLSSIRHFRFHRRSSRVVRDQLL